MKPASNSSTENRADFVPDHYRGEWVQLDAKRKKFVHQWGAASDSTATVVIVHGLGEHGGRYHRLARDFVHNGFWAVSFDQQGHGLSPEKRGCIESYETLLDDIEAILAWVTSRSKQVTLFGHSMGGNLALNYALRRPKQHVDRVISSSPMIRACKQPHSVVEYLGRILLRLAPNIRLKSVPRAERLMSDPAEQDALNRDELFHAQLSLRLGAALLDTGEWALKNASSLSMPLLLSHGTNDCLTSHIASQEFAAASTDHCLLKLWNDQLHDPFRDLERAQVVEFFGRYIQHGSEGLR